MAMKLLCSSPGVVQLPAAAVELAQLFFALKNPEPCCVCS